MGKTLTVYPHHFIVNFSCIFAEFSIVSAFERSSPGTIQVFRISSLGLPPSLCVCPSPFFPCLPPSACVCPSPSLPQVEVGGESLVVSGEWDLASPLLPLKINNTPRMLQVLQGLQLLAM